MPTATGCTELVERCKAQDRTAWTEFYRMHFPFVRRSVARLGIPDSELDDVSQETFLVAFRKIEEFKNGCLSAWLKQIVTNLVRNRLRRARFSRSLWASADSLAHSPDQEHDVRETLLQIGKVLRQMSPRKARVFILFRLKGRSAEQIAHRERCAPSTVRTWVHRARKEFVRIGVKKAVSE